MDFGTTLFFEQELGYKKSLREAAKAGFKYVDFDATEHNDCDVRDEEKVFGEFKRITDGEGMKIYQAHAPFIRKTTTDYTLFTSPEFRERLRAAIRRSAILGAKCLVAHPFIPYVGDYEHTPYDYSIVKEDNIKRSIDVFGSLKDDLKSHNIRLCIENCYSHDFVKRMPGSSACSTSAELNRIIDELGDDNYGVCFDAGHLNLLAGETIKEFVSNLKNRIKVTHLHDNFGMLNDWFGELDRHLLPFFGCLKWDELKESLDEIKFGGVISFEFCSYGPSDFAPDYYNLVMKAAKKIWEKQ